MVAPLCSTTCGDTPPAALAAAAEALLVAGEVAFNGFSPFAPVFFTFVPVSPTSAHVVTFGTLNPDSNLFDNPSPGTLRYIGTVPLRARVSYSISFIWTAGIVTPVQFEAALLRNSAIVGETIQLLSLDLTSDDTGFSASSDTMLTLSPGDELQVFINAAAITETDYTVNLLGLTIVANRI